ncbi:MAG: hypothetical protein HY909_30325 [Deltaproteobacteria bacterium]|nr:hypothetical protein [Deltaproteobacteria bacterium]
MLRADGVLVADNFQAGILADDPGTRVEVLSSVVRGTRPGPVGFVGYGLQAQEGASVRASRVLLLENTDVGVHATNLGTLVDLSDSVVRGTRPRSDGTSGHGLRAQDGAVLSAARMLVEDCAEAGAYAAGAGALLELTRSIVRGTRPRRDSAAGYGLGAQEGATLRASGVLIANTADAGILVLDRGSVADLTACAVRGTRPRSDGLFGHGIGAVLGSTLSATAVLVSDVAEVGLFVASGRAQVTDFVGLNIAPNARGLGLGVYAWRGAGVDGTRVALQHVGGAGVAALPFQGASGSGIVAGDLYLREVRSSTVRFSDSDRTARPEGRPVAYGMHAGPGCSIAVTRGVFDQGGLGFFNAGGTITLRQGVITRQFEGAGAVDLATPESRTTLEGVSFLDNATDTVTRRDDLPTASELPPSTRSE